MSKEKKDKRSKQVKGKDQRKANPKPKKGDEVLTACGSRIRFDKNTTRGEYQGQPVYFCLQLCKDDFDRDPLSSCLAIQLQGKEV